MTKSSILECSSVIALLRLFTTLSLLLLSCLPSSSYVNSCIPNVHFQRALVPCTCEQAGGSWKCESAIEVDLGQKFQLARLYFGSRNFTTSELLIHGILSRKMIIDILEEGLFDNFIFTFHISVTNTNLRLIHVNAFRTTAPTTRIINLGDNSLINSEDPDYDIFRVLRTFTSSSHINLQNNLFEYVPPNAFSGLKSLNVVKLSCNHIKTIGENAFVSAPNIAYVGLDSNKLSQLPSDFFNFKNSKDKLELDLRMNRLHGASFPSLESLSRPLKLKLVKNNLTFIDESTFSTFLLSNPESTIDVAYNHFECGCELHWLFQNRNEFKYRVSSLYCPGGQSIWNWSLQDFSNCVHNEIMPSIHPLAPIH